MGWRFGADAVLVVHLAFVLFVVAGGLLAWRWHRLARWHVPAALYGAVISAVGFTCPLTPLEKSLRRRAGTAGYDGGFVEHYVVPVLYPGEFTPTVKLALTLLVVVVNVALYSWWWQRRTHHPDRPGLRLSG